MYGVSEGSAEGWLSLSVSVTIITGVASLLALAVVELRASDPLVDLRLLSNRMFARATSLYGLASVAYLGTLFLAALYFQDALGLSAVRSGLTIFPSALGVMTGGQLVTRLLYRRLGPRRITSAGLVIIAAALVAMAGLRSGTNLWFVRLIVFGIGTGVAFVFISSQAASMATISKARTGRASAIFNASKQLGGAVGVALVSSVVAAVGPAPAQRVGTAPSFDAYHVGFLAAAVIAVLAVPVALSIRDADAAVTMSPRG